MYKLYITGIRRCGKSYLLFELFKKHLIDNGIEDNQIIEISLDSVKVKSEDWGSKSIDKLVLTIKSQYPYLKGFNRTGLYRMIQFYETYRDNTIVSPLVTQSWGIR